MIAGRWQKVNDSPRQDPAYRLLILEVRNDFERNIRVTRTGIAASNRVCELWDDAVLAILMDKKKDD